METNYRNSDLRVPSGMEVESARTTMPAGYLPPSDGKSTHGLGTIESEGWKSRATSAISGMRESMMSKGSAVGSVVSRKSSAVAGAVSRKSSAMRESLNNGLARARTMPGEVSTRAQASMRSEPMKWAGGAAGAGLILGGLGRYLKARSKHHHHRMPTLVVVETSC